MFENCRKSNAGIQNLTEFRNFMSYNGYLFLLIGKQTKHCFLGKKV